MKYINKQTNKITWIHEIRALHPQISIPNDADLSDLGYEKIIPTEPPQMEGFYAVEVDPVDFKQTWELKPIEVIVPEIITPLQAKLQLLEMDLFDDVETILSNNPKYKIYWENAQTIERNSIILLEIAGLLNLTSIEIDNMFISANKILV